MRCIVTGGEKAEMLSLYLSLIDEESEKGQFEEIYLSYRKQMFLLANSILRNEQDAEDTVHDVFYSVASSHMYIITEAKNKTDIRNYLLKSVKNASFSLLRKKKTRLEYEENNQKEQSVFSDDEFLDRLCSQLEGQELMNAMSALDQKYREVLYYHFVLDLSVSETAKLLGREPDTVRKQITRGKNILSALFLRKED